MKQKKVAKCSGSGGCVHHLAGGISPVIAFLDEQELSKWKQTHVFLNFSLQLLLSSTVMEHSLEYGFLFYIQEVQPSILMKNGCSVPRSSWVCTYCWWFRNLKTTTVYMYEAPVNNGIWTTKLNWLAGRISSNHQQHFPVKMVIFVGFFTYFPPKLPLKLTHLSPRQLTKRKPRFFHIGKVPGVQLAIGFLAGPTWQFAPDFRRAPSYPKEEPGSTSSQLRGVSFFLTLKKPEKNVQFFDPFFWK